LSDHQSGKCRICGCTEDNACVFAWPSDEHAYERVACAWFDADRTLCTNPKCIGKVTISELYALTPAITRPRLRRRPRHAMERDSRGSTARTQVNPS